MKAMILSKTASMDRVSNPLEPADLPVPRPRSNEILVKVSACGVCHTELDEIEGRVKPPRLPIVPGHEVVGMVEKRGSRARRFRTGERVGIGWIHSCCGTCRFCREGNENLCEKFAATGLDANGGYAEYITVPEDSAYRIPSAFSDSEAAPLLCAGGVGYRSLRLAGIGKVHSLGLTGFGACGHLTLQMARHEYPKLRTYVFARSRKQRDFARRLGADWTGSTESRPPEMLDCIIDTTPAWNPPVKALRCLRPGGRLVINAIRKGDSDKESLMDIDYQRDLWVEKEIKSVANVTRRDIADSLKLAASTEIRPRIKEYNLEDANRALQRLKSGHIRGALVLVNR
jgi:propanol-preferring alcohol dehydrogenase